VLWNPAEIAGGERVAPGGRRAPFGWGIVRIPTSNETPLSLRWSEHAPGRLRITIALSMRSTARVGVFAGSNEQLGAFDIRYAPGIQTFEIHLPKTAPEIQLRVIEGDEPVWIFDGDSTATPVPDILRPHLLSLDGRPTPINAFLGRMSTLDCVQMFGWMEGCVLDGMLELHERSPGLGFHLAARQHVDLFLKDDGTLTFENMHSEPEENQLKTIEETLMFAATARVKPEHPSLKIARDFWEARHRQFGYVTDPGMPSAEGCYTVAYPLAMVGKLLDVPQYLDWAVNELRTRRDRLVLDGDIWLRSYDDGRRTFKNWSRGVAWYFLGMVKTIALLQDRKDINDLRDEAQRVAAFVLARRNERGIWGGFVGENEVTPDTAGSSGITAALAFGARHNLLDNEALTATRNALPALADFLTDDGMLRGVSQSNRGGEALQRSDYRVIFPMGMGLLAQFFAYRPTITSASTPAS
jgi:rhamnogalacturonyl hydrolase YesR